MKGQLKRNVSALFAALLGIVILTSARVNPENKAITASIEFDMSFEEDVEEYVDDYIESMIELDIEDQAEEMIKIYDEDGALLIEESATNGELSEEAQKLLRQAEFLTEYDNTSYYRL